MKQLFHIMFTACVTLTVPANVHTVGGGDAPIHFEGYAYDANNNPTSAYTVYIKLNGTTLMGSATPNSSGFWAVTYSCPDIPNGYYTLELGNPAVGARGGVSHSCAAPCSPHYPTTRNLKVGDFIDE
jgi:hypothetical protein